MIILSVAACQLLTTALNMSRLGELTSPRMATPGYARVWLDVIR